MTDNLTSPCCNAGYKLDNVSFCCTAQISESGLCYECKEHTEAEGYICDDCDNYFDEPIKEKHYCSFCGEDLEEDGYYCSKECSVADNTERV
jgi:predicted amidophosphoribosyltransferase